MPYSVTDEQDHEVLATYLFSRRALREALKDRTLCAVHGNWPDWFRYLLSPPAPFILFIVACLFLAVIALV